VSYEHSSITKSMQENIDSYLVMGIF
jgi:hypothetical protein